MPAAIQIAALRRRRPGDSAREDVLGFEPGFGCGVGAGDGIGFGAGVPGRDGGSGTGGGCGLGGCGFVGPVTPLLWCRSGDSSAELDRRRTRGDRGVGIVIGRARPGRSRP